MRRINWPIAALALGIALAAASATVAAQDMPLVVGTAPATAPFTLSKETTVLTEPLREDGTVDYVAALNRKYGDGVKPEDNGWVVWMTQVNGKGQVSDKTAAVTLRMAGITGPDNPPEMKPFVRFLQEAGVGDAAAVALEEHFEHLTAPWAAEDFPELSAYLDSCKTNLDAAVVAANKLRWWVPGVSSDGRSMMTVMLPSLASVRQVGNLLDARALHRLNGGDFEGFLSDITAAKKIGRKMQSEFLIGTLVGLAMDQHSDLAIAGAAASGKLTAEQAGRLEKMLADLPPIHNVAAVVDVVERWGLLDIAQTFAVRKFTGPNYSDDATAARSLDQIDPDAVDWDTVFKAINGMIDAQVVMIRTRGIDARAVIQAAPDKKIEGGWPTGEHARGLLHRNGETREAYTQRVSGAIIQVFLSSVDRSAEQEDRAAMTHEMTAALVRAAATHARTGAWPTALTDLPPDINQKGQPPVYTVGKAGPTVTWPGNGRPVTLGAAEPAK